VPSTCINKKEKKLCGEAKYIVDKVVGHKKIDIYAKDVLM
jgi:hypothetical protein